jgi:chemotaxis signal transduction protein
MKLSKFLIFRVNDQKFAVKANQVINVIEHTISGIEKQLDKNYFSFNFRGMDIPLLFIHKLMDDPLSNPSIIILLELQINKNYQLIGISADEIIEITTLDDILSYPLVFNNNSADSNNFGEEIIIHNNEPIIVLKIDYYLLKNATLSYLSSFLAN